MGANGRQHALNSYDWKVIILYENLWSELKSRRDAEDEGSQLPHPCSSSRSFLWFCFLPNEKIRPQSLLCLSDKDSDVAIRRFRKLIQLKMVSYVKDRMASQQQLESLLLRLSSTSVSAKPISETCSNADEQRRLFLSIVWMIKLGLIKFDMN